MTKKIYLSCMLLLVSVSTALGMSLVDLTTQINHVNAQINAAKRSWNEARLRVKLAEKASSALCAQFKPIFEKIISSDAFVTKMNAAIDQQFDSITNGNRSFKEVKIENNLSGISSQSMGAFGRALYSAMANKAYCASLGTKLAQKSRDLAAAMVAAQQAMIVMPTTTYSTSTYPTTSYPS